MTDSKRLNMVLGILAVVILVTSSITFAYTLIPKGDTSIVIVNEVEYTWGELFDDVDLLNEFRTITFEIDGESYSGIRLSDIVNDTGLANPSAHQYKVYASDGYQKDVSWENMLNGFLTLEDKKTVFPGLTRSYWVGGLEHPVTGIEVV